MGGESNLITYLQMYDLTGRPKHIYTTDVLNAVGGATDSAQRRRVRAPPVAPWDTRTIGNDGIPFCGVKIPKFTSLQSDSARRYSDSAELR